VRLRRMPEVYAPYFGVLLAVAGTVKNSALPQTVLPSFSGNSCDAQRHRMGLEPEKLAFVSFNGKDDDIKTHIDLNNSQRFIIIITQRNLREAHYGKLYKMG
ncbi:MAG: hypothetical protein P8Y08_12385, partial [Desulfobulbaceae bacterium]